jgi:DNA-binding protein Fis
MSAGALQASPMIAQYLGLNRATLRKKLEKHGIPS